MNINIAGRKVHIKDEFKERVNKKLEKFEKMFGPDTDAYVTVTVEKNRQTVEVTIKRGGHFYRAEQTCEDMEDALDEVISKLAGQMRKHKAKLEKRHRGEGITFELLIGEGSGEPEQEAQYHIKRSKRFPIKPMDIEEAILQMNMIGHQFYMFRNQNTEEINVVYHRKSGDYGLLEPDISEDED